MFYVECRNTSCVCIKCRSAGCQRQSLAMKLNIDRRHFSTIYLITVGPEVAAEVNPCSLVWRHQRTNCVHDCTRTPLDGCAVPSIVAHEWNYEQKHKYSTTHLHWIGWQQPARRRREKRSHRRTSAFYADEDRSEPNKCGGTHCPFYRWCRWLLVSRAPDQHICTIFVYTALATGDTRATYTLRIHTHTHTWANGTIINC